jgi:TRAP transporter TAXI family solute receptor
MLSLNRCKIPSRYPNQSIAGAAGVAKRRKHRVRDLLKIYGPAVLLTLLAFLVAYQFVDPAPPKRLVIATGSPEGAYAGFAQEYRNYLGRESVELEIRHTRGSVENLALLSSGEVDVAFVQGGTEQAATEPLLALGSVYYEPAWLFYRGDRLSERLTDMAGARVAVGASGSGTLALARTLLADNQMLARHLVPVERGGAEAAKALRNGELDAAFFVSGAQSPLIRDLIKDPEIRLMGFRRATAYTRLHPYLSEVVLPEGIIDLKANIPDRDVRLLAPAATLVVHPDLHPALQDLMLQAAREVHGRGGLFEAEDAFPSSRHNVFPLSPEARRFYKSGPPLLQRYLPFWAATLVDRLKVMLLPLVVILLPLVKVMPPIYNWRMRSRIYRWYSDLDAVERQLEADEPDVDEARAELRRIEQEVSKVHVPLPFAAQAYDLRMHIGMVHGHLDDRQTKTKETDA